MLVTIPDDYPPLITDSAALELLNSYPGLELEVYCNSFCTKNDLRERVKNAHTAIIMHDTTRLTASIMEASSLQHVAVWGISTGHVAVDAAARLGIVVSNNAEALIESEAEHALALMLSLLHRIPEMNTRLRLGEWATGFLTQLSGRQLGIVGLGPVGLKLANLASGIGMQIVASELPDLEGKNLSDKFKASGAKMVDFETLLTTSDVISVHAEHLPSTEQIFDSSTFAKMNTNTYFINVSAGKLVDEFALADALRTETIAGAGLDTFSSEPLEKDNPLLKLPNTILTPRVGSNTLQATQQSFKKLVNNVINFIEGHPIDSYDILK